MFKLMSQLNSCRKKVALNIKSNESSVLNSEEENVFLFFFFSLVNIYKHGDDLNYEPT